jgi:uncharacterized membrane protein
MLLLFGIGHFLSGPAISALVPKYIPWPLFWTYLGGVALVGSALSISLILSLGGLVCYWA